MITLERITKATIKDRLAEVAKLYPIAKCFFAHPLIMHSFLNVNGPELWLASNETEKYIVVSKMTRIEYRFLFKKPSEAFIKELQEQSRATYLATNLLTERMGREFWLGEDEIIFDVEKILAMGDHDFRKQYNRALRKNPTFEVSRFDYDNDLPDLLVFLDTWRMYKVEQQKIFADIEKDMNFLASFGREDFVKGIVIRHAGRIISYCIYAHYFDSTCTSIFSKSLRGYENLGAFQTIEKCKAMKEDGFTHAYAANIVNEFKKSLHWAGEVITIYAERDYKDEGLRFGSTPERYLNSIAR